MKQQNVTDCPKISVLMSVYKEPLEWVTESIESILNQTLSDFEFIIVNDNPESIELKTFLDDYSKKDNRIKLITNQQNIGLTKSLNIGLKQCKGEYIARMDADDWSYPDRFAKQEAFMDANPDVIASGAIACLWNGSKCLRNFNRPSTQEDIITYTFNTSPFIHPLLILRREMIQKYHIQYDEEFLYSQDYKLAIDLLKYGKIVNLPELLLKYRVSGKQITIRCRNEQDKLSQKIRRIYVNNYYDSLGLRPLEEKITLDSVIWNENSEQTIMRTHDLSSEQKKIFKRRMRSIRRLMYYSLSDYSVKSLIHFVLSFDYLYNPYKFRRFVIIVVKHLMRTIVVELL